MLISCLILNLGCECQTIVISFKNDALLHQSHRQGIYQRAGKVNGKTSWISSSGSALWYYPGSSDWMIGSVDNLGTGTRGISSIGNQGISSCPYNVANDVWEYGDNNGMIIPDGNDINVECLSGNDRFASLSFIWKSQYTTYNSGHYKVAAIIWGSVSFEEIRQLKTRSLL